VPLEWEAPSGLWDLPAWKSWAKTVDND
jgi:hypothetical protein